MLVKARLYDLGRVFKIVDEVLFRDVENLDLRILTEIDVVDEELQRAPRGFELAELAVVHNLVDLIGKLLIQLDYHRVDESAAHLRRRAARSYLADKLLKPSARNVVAFVGRLDLRRFYNFVQQTGNGGSGLLLHSLSLFLSHPYLSSSASMPSS